MSNSIFRKDGTAQGVAKQRYIETLADPAKRVIDDPYSSIFTLGAGLIKLMGHGLNLWLTNKLAPGFHEHLIARTRFIDDLVKESTENGIEQYVILGAGYDMRAHRLDLPASLKIFEGDQPAVQSKKISKLPKELSDLDSVSYVNVDFANQSVSERLVEAGFDQTKSSIFKNKSFVQDDSEIVISSQSETIIQSEEEINSGLRIRTLANEIVVCICGSAFKNKGVQPMLDAVIEYLPSPTEN